MIVLFRESNRYELGHLVNMNGCSFEVSEVAVFFVELEFLLFTVINNLCKLQLVD